MTHAHGTVIVCERIDGATVAWVDEQLSVEMPAGYFIEIMEGQRGMPDRVRAGTMAGGYATLAQIAQVVPVTGVVLSFGEAVRWCWQDRKRRERERKAAA